MMLRSLEKEVENILAVKFFRGSRWNYSSLKYSLKSVVNIPTLGIKTGPLESFISEVVGALNHSKATKVLGEKQQFVKQKRSY